MVLLWEELSIQMKIKLTKEELDKCKYIAERWDTTTGKYAIKYKQKNKKVFGDTLAGVKSEMAVAKYLEIPYDGDIGIAGNFDVGGKYEVRGTTYKNGCLLLHPEDKPAPYILVIEDGDTFELAGWIMGEEGKKKEYWREDVRSPCYFVPQYRLNDISLLK